MKDIDRKLRDIDLGIYRKRRIDDTSLGFQGILAGEAGHKISQWMSQNFNHNFDNYDKAIDSVYNQTHIGGSAYHHLLDGQHTLLNSLKAIKDINADDSWAQELLQASEHLLRDLTSVSGINPIFSITPDQFDKLGNIVSSIGITKEYLADALAINGPELLGGSLALVSAIIIGKKSDPERLSYLSGGCLVSSLVSANPLLFSVAASSMTYAILKNYNKKSAIIQIGKGSIVSGSTLLVSSMIGGPIWIGCIAGLMTAIAVSKGLDKAETSFKRNLELINPARHVLQKLLLQT
jgi:hypothetical protein